jgi:hypothetical protein
MAMNSDITTEIAIAAARLIVDEGLDYGSAKRHAARSVAGGQVRSAELPSNEAIEDEVRAHIALFCADTQPGELLALRRTARIWMERLADFRPHVCGAVWRGTATRQSSIHLDLFCDDSKAAEIELINRGIDFDVDSLPGGPRSDPIDVLTLATACPELGESVTLHLHIKDHNDLRGALKPDAGGRTLRGDLAALTDLLESAP